MAVHRMLLLLGLWAAFLLSVPGLAWAVPEQVQPGTYGVTGCPSINLTPCFSPYSVGNPLPVTISGGGGGGTIAALYTYNQVIAVTGTPIQLSASTQALANGLSCFVIAAGANKISIGSSGSVTNPQTVSFGGSAIGTYLSSGMGWAAGISAPNLIFINGTAGDGVTCWGN